jgi:hypothetical protein
MTKTQLTKKGMASIEEYFEEILNAKNSADHNKAVEYFNELTPKQVDTFLSYVAESYHYENEDIEEGGGVLNSELQELQKYFNI